jgi:uncharacterized protein (TIGR02596 family)
VSKSNSNSRIPHRRRSAAAFTITELLAVVGIMVVLIAMFAPTANTILRGSNITQASDLLGGQLALARQTAAVDNRNVEVRFYAARDPEAPGKTSELRSFQIFRIEDDGTAKALGKVQQLPTAVIISSDTTFSTLVSPDRSKSFSSTDPQVSIPRAGTLYDAYYFRFRPDGSTDLDPTLKWYLTVYNETDKPTAGSPPPNYATIQIDPISGDIMTYRP